MVAVVYSHSHIDHAAGVRGVVDEADVKAGKVKIYTARKAFLVNFIEENVFCRHRDGPPESRPRLRQPRCAGAAGRDFHRSRRHEPRAAH